MKAIKNGFKGLSPIVSVVLLILIAVAASVLIYAWISGMATQNPAQEPALLERLKIEAVSYDKQTQTLTVYYRNVGDVPLKVVAGFVIEAVSGQTVCENTNLNEPAVNPGQTESTTIGGCTLQAGTTYIVKLVTASGIEAVYTYTVPQS